MTRLLALVLALGVAACSSEAATTEEPVQPPADLPEREPVKDPAPVEPEKPVTPPPALTRWDKFAAGRKAALVALAQPILSCVSKQDTTNPSFHGCIDWHSAVHGTWALLALSRLTADPSFEQATVPILQPGLLATELDNLEQRGTAFEVPYGYAWFLVLAGERAKANKTDLEPLALHVLNLLDSYVTNMTEPKITQSLLADDYQNLSWAIFNVWQYAKQMGDNVRAERMVTLARTRLMPRDADCPLTRDATPSGFFPACLHRARAVITMLPAAESKTWATSFLPATFALTPIVDPAAAHEAGLNFSRSWGLYSLYKSTGNEAYRDLYMDHMEPWLKRTNIWSGNYQQYSHWVAQFGVYALALSFE